MSFHDYSRTLTVSGNSPDQVDAVFSTLRDDLQALSTPLGGSGLRSALGTVTVVVLANVLIVLGLMFFESRRKIVLLPMSVVFLLLALLFTLPLGDVLAGFIAVSGDASFTVRYGGQISFFGFILGVVGLPAALVPLFSRKKT